MRKWYVHALTGQAVLLLLCLISVVSCLPPSGVDSAAYSDAASGIDSPALTAEDVILREEFAEVQANQFLFPKIKSGYLKESGMRAILEVEFRSGAPFSLKKFGVAMNGGLGHYPEVFDLNRVSRWVGTGTAPKLHLEVGKLAFGGSRSFFEQASRVQSHRGQVILWLLSSAREIVRAKIIFVRERPSRAPAGVLSVQWDAVPPEQSERKAVEFRFHSPDGTPLFFECAKDKQAFHRCESPKSFNRLAVGNHVFYARAVDNQKRRGPYLAYAFEILKPSNSVVIQKTEPTDSPTSSDSLKVWFTSASTLDPKKKTIVCQLDGGEYAACASPVTFSNLAEGWHEVQVRIQNKKDKLIGTGSSYAWYVDRTVPEVQFQEAPAPLTSETFAHFTWIVSEEASFRCRLDSGADADCVSPLELTGLGSGAHSLSLQARDEAGNLSTVLEYAWTVENRPPRISLDSILPAEAVSSSTSLRATFSADKPSLFQCRLDGAGEDGCVSPFVAENLNDGEHELEIIAVDLAGNVSESVLYRWAVDTTIPQVNIEWKAPGQSPTNQTSAEFAFHSSDATRFYCDLNHGGVFLCASPWQVSGIGEGEQLLIVSAVDAAGNASAPASFQWFVDLTAPRLTLGRVEPVATRTSSRTLTIEFEADEAGFTQCELDGAGTSACLSPHSLSGLADGAHRFSVMSRDAAGNVSEPLVYEWLVESIPSVSIQSATPAETLTSSRQISVLFAADLPATFECRLDGESFQVCVSPWVREELASGPHAFEVRALNDLGTAGASAFYRWEVDAEAPALEWLGADPSLALTSSRTIHFSFSSDAGASFLCRVDGGGEAPCVSPLSLADLLDGPHDFVVVAQDSLGNRSSAYSYHWEVDATAPSLSPLARSPASETVKQREVSITFSASEEATFSCRSDGQAEQVCQSPWALSGLTDGSHEVVIMAKDAAGNESASSSLTFRVDATPPVASLLYRTPSAALTNSRQVEIGFSANEAASFQCGVDGAASASCHSPLHLTSLSDGQHRVEIRAVDTAGNTGDPISVSWEVDATGPTVVLVSRNPATEIAATNALVVNFTASEPSQYYCALDGQVPALCNSPFSVAGIADGNHTFQIFARDAAGNDGLPISFGWAIDTVRPTITSLTRVPSPPVVNQKTLTLQWSGSESGTFHCALDGAPAQPCSSPSTLSNLSEGGHQFALGLTDAAGNVSDPSHMSWSVDTIAPNIQGYSRNPAEDPSNSRSFLLHFSANESGASFFCSLDGAAFSPCNNPLGISAMMDGSHTFRVYARDAAGNDGGQFSDAWLVDGTAPTMNLTGRTPAGALVSSRSVAISFSANDAGASLYCSMDGASFLPCVSPFSAQNLGEGSHNFQVYARDIAGNQSASASDNWTVDTVAPSVLSLARSPLGSLISAKTVTFTFGASEGGVSYFCSVDGGASQACGSPYSLSNLAEGNHTLQLFARDAAGNVGATVNDSWAVDTLAPTLSLTSRTPAGSLVAVGSLSIAFSSPDNSATFFCSLDGQAASACSSPFSASNLADGSHSFQIFARDAAGNQSVTVSDSWSVDTVLPVVTLTSRSPAGAVITSKSVTLTFNVNDTGATLYCSLDGQGASACSSPFNASNLGDGSHSFQVYARDVAGNQSVTISDSWTVDATPPIAQLGARTPSGSLVTSKSVSIAFSSNDPGATFFCSLDGQSASACGSPFSANNLGEGSHSFQVYARDAAGNQSANVSDSWTVDTVAPSMTLSGRTPAGTLINVASVTINFSSIDGAATFFCALDGQAASACASPYSASGLAQGPHSFQVYARDVAGNQSAVVSDGWTVDTVAPFIIWGSMTPSYSPSISQVKSIAFSATEAASFFCSVDGGGFGSCSSPYNGSGLADGTHSLSVRAMDAAGNLGVASSQTWEVNTAVLTTTNVAITSITQSSAQIGWTTSIPANSRVVYGTGSNLNLSTTLDPVKVANHSVTLSGLAKFTFYSVQTVSVDPDGRETRSNVRTFRTSN